jgi:hypothetical protein
MRPVHSPDLTHAVPLEGKVPETGEFSHGRTHGRTPAVRLALDERDRYLVEAAKFYPGCSDREIERPLRIALSTYRAGRWRRDRAEALCPAQHRGKLTQTLWCLLKSRDAIPSERLVRAVLARGRR